ncbi:MAG TPA: DUF6625 family protein [Terracidiphilus sp.]|nr:DUF6625 family protein [Terracidiphilus sp.]
MSSRLPRITLIGAYFGAFPFYFSLFIKSAGANPEIQFLIVTDQRRPPVLPANIYFLNMDKGLFERLASERIGHKMRLARVRKLCDYKPAYGQIFCEFIRGADYWGHIDFDIVWGNIAKFLIEPLDTGYDVISADGARLSGPFTIYRNNKELRSMFREIPDIVAKLNSDESLDLDEQEFDLLVKQSGVALMRGRFSTRNDVSLEELRGFLANEETYRLVSAGLNVSATTGRRLPAAWRNGELWNCLPKRDSIKIRLLNSMFVHLTTARVRFTVDFRRDLILPSIAKQVTL